MPYINDKARDELVTVRDAATAGELNYQITALLIQYVFTKGLSYETLNAVVGACESAKAEFQRRVVAPYEKIALAKNGDVYPTTLLSKE